MKTLEENPELYELAKAYDPGNAPVEKAASAEVPVAIEKAADAILARKGSKLSREAARVQALQENPDLYELWRQHDERSRP